LGELWREWNDLDVALDHLTEAIDLAAQWSEVAALDAFGPLARIRAAQGDWTAAQEALETARGLALKSESTEVDDRVVELQRAHLMLSQGDLRGARRWAEKRGLSPDLSETLPPGPDQAFVEQHLRKYEQGVFARLLLVEDRIEAALGLLDALLVQARALDRTDLVIDLQILSALALQAQGDEAEAISALAEALSLAEPGGYVRVFVDEGPAMAALLRRAASRGISPAYVARLLKAFVGSGVESQEGQVLPRLQPLIEPLSEREIEVLQLLARGMSNPEIAHALFIAVSTVRSHCKSIYAKLGVHKRWDAVQRAQELDLL
jgi:LuxR family maltose regulon positive regulatory protein